MMKINTLQAAMSMNSYPGRGIAIGLHGDGQRAVIAYFIMGRSVNSRNRVFVPDAGGLRTQAFDPSKMVDPSLVIYAPVRTFGKTTVVTNGDQTDTIIDCLERGGRFEDALMTRTFEPDAPNYTPRISGLVKVENGKLDYKLSILKSADANPSSCQRFFYVYDEPIAGVGHFIHTYKCDGDPLPSFEGEPEPVALSGSIDQIAGEIWGALDSENKVSLFVRTIELADGSAQTRIINQNQ